MEFDRRRRQMVNIALIDDEAAILENVRKCVENEPPHQIFSSNVSQDSIFPTTD